MLLFDHRSVRFRVNETDFHGSQVSVSEIYQVKVKL